MSRMKRAQKFIGKKIQYKGHFPVLVSAFPTIGNAKTLLSFNGFDPTMMEGNVGLTDLWFRAVTNIRAQGRLQDLIHAAKGMNPGNEDLRRLPS